MDKQLSLRPLLGSRMVLLGSGRGRLHVSYLSRKNWSYSRDVALVVVRSRTSQRVWGGDLGRLRTRPVRRHLSRKGGGEAGSAAVGGIKRVLSESVMPKCPPLLAEYGLSPDREVWRQDGSRGGGGGGEVSSPPSVQAGCSGVGSSQSSTLRPSQEGRRRSRRSDASAESEAEK